MQPEKLQKNTYLCSIAHPRLRRNNHYLQKKMPKECLLLTPQMIRVIRSLCLLLASWDGGFGIFQEFAEVPRESALRTSSPPSYLSGMPPAIGHKTNLPRISHVILGADSPHLHLRFGAAREGGWGDWEWAEMCWPENWPSLGRLLITYLNITSNVIATY